MSPEDCWSWVAASRLKELNGVEGGWMDEWMDAWTDKWLVEWISG